MATAEDLLRIMTQMQVQQTQQQQHEQLMAQLITQQQTQVPAPAVPRAAERPESRSELAPTFITRPQFNGKAEQWEAFQFRLKRAVRSQSAVVQEEMSRVEGSETIINDTHDPGIDSDGVNASTETSACLFDILAQHVEGEALVIIKLVTDYHGFEAVSYTHLTLPTN